LLCVENELKFFVLSCMSYFRVFQKNFSRISVYV